MNEPLTATEIVRGETTLRIKRLLPEQQFELFEFCIRPHLGAIIEAVGGDIAAVLKRLIPMFEELRSKEGMSGADLLEMVEESSIASVISTIGKALSGLPPEALKKARDTMFDQVYFTNKMSPRGQKVTQAMGTAFYQRPFVEIYDLTVRAFCVNFGDSWPAIASLLGMAGDQDSSLPDSST